MPSKKRKTTEAALAAAAGEVLGRQVVEVGVLRAHLEHGAVLPVEPAPGALAREFRILMNLQSPSLVIRQVEVQTVELVQRQDIDESAQIRGGEEVPRDVHMHSAPGEAWRILDAQCGDVDALAGSRAQQLPERDRAIEQAALVAGRHAHAVRRERHEEICTPSSSSLVHVRATHQPKAIGSRTSQLRASG